jgi:hypothetical protein
LHVALQFGLALLLSKTVELGISAVELGTSLHSSLWLTSELSPSDLDLVVNATAVLSTDAGCPEDSWARRI